MPAQESEPAEQVVEATFLLVGPACDAAAQNRAAPAFRVLLVDEHGEDVLDRVPKVSAHLAEDHRPAWMEEKVAELVGDSEALPRWSVSWA